MAQPPHSESDPASHVRVSPWFAIGCAAIAAVAAVVFKPSLSNDFVWDDRANVVEIAQIRSFEASDIVWAFSTFNLGHYQPLTWLSYLIDSVLWVPGPRGMRMTNIILHCLNAVLFAFVARRLLLSGVRVHNDLRTRRSAEWIALLAAAVFALHPMRVESVAWITERRDVLCSAFFLASVWMYLVAVAPQKLPVRKFVWLAGSVVMFALSLLSKPLGMSLPLALMAIDLYPLGRRQAGPRWTSFGTLVAEKVPYLALAFASGVVALAAQHETGALTTIQEHSLVNRLVQVGYGLTYYLRATFAQIQWLPLYERPVPFNPMEARFILLALVSLAVTVGLIALRRRFPALLTAWVCYGLLLLPVLGVAQSGVQIVADRYSYLACLSIVIVASAGVVSAWRACRTKVAKSLLASAVTIAVVAWSVLTWQQTRVWKNESTLWQHVLKAGPSAMAHNNLGAIALQEGDVNDAIDHFASAVEVIASYGRARGNLLNTLMNASPAPSPASEVSPDVRKRAEQVLRSLPEWAPAGPEEAFVLGTLALRDGRFDRAARDFEVVVKAKPDLARGWIGLGQSLCAAGRLEAALSALRTAVSTRPDLAEPRLALAACLIDAGQTEEARELVEAVLREEPHNSNAARLKLRLSTGSP